MIWFTADTHFGHTNIIDYTNRPFKTVEEMDDTLINNWNAYIQLNDEVWHLGDFSFRSDPLLYSRRLNGKINLILGNHDFRNLDLIKKVMKSVQDVKQLKYSGETFFLSHYGHRVWPKSHHGAFHLYGHSHGELPGMGRSMDVGVDANQYLPISINDVIKKLSKIESTFHHAK